MCLFSLMFIVVGVFRFISCTYFLFTRATFGVYLRYSTCCLRLTKSDNISFSHLNQIASSLGIWGETT